MIIPNCNMGTVIIVYVYNAVLYLKLKAAGCVVAVIQVVIFYTFPLCLPVRVCIELHVNGVILRLCSPSMTEIVFCNLAFPNTIQGLRYLIVITRTEGNDREYYHKA